MGREGVGVKGDKGHTANKVLNSTRPTAALRRLPLTNKYPMSMIDSADKTIKATRQLRTDCILVQECSIFHRLLVEVSEADEGQDR